MVSTIQIFNIEPLQKNQNFPQIMICCCCTGVFFYWKSFETVACMKLDYNKCFCVFYQNVVSSFRGKL
jgi:hypothetical protein